MPAPSAFVAFQIQNVCMYIYLHIICVHTNGLCQHVLCTVAILKEYYSCKFNHSKVGRARKNTRTLLMAFTGICWQQRNAEAEDSLGSISALVRPGPIPLFPPDPKHQHSSLSRPALCRLSWSLAPCSQSAQAKLSHGSISPSASCSAQSHHLHGTIHLCPPFPAGSGGGIQLHVELQRCSRLSEDIRFLRFLPLITVSLLSIYDWQSSKSHNVPNLQEFSQDIQKAHPKREDRPDMLKSPSPKLGGQ